MVRGRKWVKVLYTVSAQTLLVKALLPVLLIFKMAAKTGWHVVSREETRAC